MVTRRQFLKTGLVVATALALPSRVQFGSSGAGSSAISFGAPVAWAFYQSNKLQKFVQPLRGVGPGGIPVAVPDLTRAPVTGVTHYTLEVNEFQDQLHPSLGLTTLRGYQPTRFFGSDVPLPQAHLGGIVVAEKDVPLQFTFRNRLPARAIMPVDTSVMGAEPGQPTNRLAVHIHGGHVPWISDGGPLAWWTPDGMYGTSFINNQVLNPGAQANEAEYFYPNDQSARLMWYHDHAFGITRLNAYSGIATAYLIRDNFERSLRDLGLPEFMENGGRYELPIVIQDKIFVNEQTILAQDPTWTGPTATGSLWYPHVYEGKRWEIGPGGAVDAHGDLTQNPSVIPEMFGDTMLANGTVYPVAQVEPRVYRLRILNACQARFLNLQLYVDDGSPDAITLSKKTYRPANAKGPDWLVIGTEGGFLAHPARVAGNVPFSVAFDAEGDPIGSTIQGSLITGLAERWDVLVDFSRFAGKRIILYNDAPAPFPMGDPLNDYFPGNPGNPTPPKPGYGPNTRQIMAFQVAGGGGGDLLRIDASTDLTRGIDESPVHMWTTAPLPPPPGVPVRHLTLNESFDSLGRLIQRLGTWDQPAGSSDYGRAYLDPTTEVVRNRATEVWQVANLTGDTHPMHFHLVNVQILSRQPFENSDDESFNGAPIYSGPARGPDSTELGWKETVKMHPGEVTTVIMRFDLPKVPFKVPESPRTGGNEYVWHCHILEHEEHDMMRPLIVT